MLRHITLLVVASAVVACGPETNVVYDYAPYEGEAYPDQREPIEVPAAGMGVVSDSLSDTLSFVDLGSGQRFASVPVGRDPVTIDGPHHVAVDRDRGAAYVALSYPIVGGGGPHGGHGVTIADGWVQALALDDFRPVGEVRVDAAPGDVVLSDDGSRLVVSHFDLARAQENADDPEAARATIAIIDPATLGAPGSPSPARVLVCPAAHGIALERPAAARAFVTCYGDDHLAVVDLDAAEVVDLVPVGPSPGDIGDPTYGPYAAALSPDGSLLAITSTVSKDVRVFDVALGAMTEVAIPTLGAPFFPAWSPDGALLYVPVQAPDGVVVLDAANAFAELERRDFFGAECPAPHEVELVGDDLFVVCEGDHDAPGKVLTLAVDGLAVRAETEVGVFPDAITPVFAEAP